jgi:hypothetical protein
MDLDRRVDSRTDLDYSLRNLLQTRARRHEYLVAVLTTNDGLVLAASGTGNDRLAAQAAAHASIDAPLADPAGGVRLVNKRFDVDGQPLLLAVLRPGTPSSSSAAAPGDDSVLTDMARRVQAILGERRLRAG